MKTESISAKDYQKHASKSVPALLKLATKVFNAFIRSRDCEGELFTCISCGLPKPKDQLQAGHFMSAGHHSPTRFDEDNCHGQCLRCNHFLSGNLAEYRKRLIDKIGLARVEAVETKAKMKGWKWEKANLIAIILKYKVKK